MAKTKTKPAETTPIFIRISPVNKRWLDQQVVRTGHYRGHVLDAVLDAVRKGEVFSLEPRVMVTLNRIKKQHEQRIAGYRKS